MTKQKKDSRRKRESYISLPNGELAERSEDWGGNPHHRKRSPYLPIDRDFFQSPMGRNSQLFHYKFLHQTFSGFDEVDAWT